MVAFKQDGPKVLPLSPEMMLPDLLAAYPQARRVFDRYGLSGCGGRLGPVETIRFFARSHGVDEPTLMAELKQAIESGVIAPEAKQSVADTIYRRFFMGGIAVILSAGATWGAWLLWKIGFAGTFTSTNSIHEVNSHGHAQIYGWVGLFIMGFAYQAFPRLWHTTLALPRLAVVAFVAMLWGIIIRSVGMVASQSAWGTSLALAGGLLEIASILMFVTQILLTFRRSGEKLQPYIAFAVGALFWFVAMSVMDVWHTYMTMTAGSREQLLAQIATYQAPLRDIQIHGLALFMILGVSLRMLPALFELPQVPDRRAWSALALLSAAVIGETTLFVAYRWTGNHILAAMLLAPWIMLAISAALIAGPWKLWRPFKVQDRSGKFVRAAYGWLAVSLAMLLLLPLYQGVYANHVGSSGAFSHAYYGAIRHAITVGFISLMIMGFAAKVVPTLNGIDTRKLTQLWGPFMLVNLGCFLRVSLQTLTDWSSAFYPIIGLSGTLEVVGMAWWGIGLVRIMRRGKREAQEYETSTRRPDAIEPTHVVADVLAWYPQTLDVLDRFGFTMLRNPLLRRTMARTVTLRQAAGMKGVEIDALVAALNTAIRKTARAHSPNPVDPPTTLTIGGKSIA